MTGHEVNAEKLRKWS